MYLYVGSVICFYFCLYFCLSIGVLTYFLCSFVSMFMYLLICRFLFICSLFYLVIISFCRLVVLFVFLFVYLLVWAFAYSGVCWFSQLFLLLFFCLFLGLLTYFLALSSPLFIFYWFVSNFCLFVCCLVRHHYETSECVPVCLFFWCFWRPSVRIRGLPSASPSCCSQDRSTEL